jgi:ABC-type multidrug transport system fused ATPase/permease subunit
VNGEALNSDNFREWQKLIGYVPQSVYLSEESIAKNIAFGVDDKDIDMSLVRRVSEMASLHQFVTSRLPEAYETRVGERGVRLSGGERQRIGIARALYRQPKLLVLDEATSALDNITEAEVMNAINDIGSDTTLIIIAHRLSTVKSCDRLYVVAEGRIIREGSYSELQQSSVFSAFLTAPK